MSATRREVLLQGGAVLGWGLLQPPPIFGTGTVVTRSDAPPSTDGNGVYTETWLGHLAAATCIAGYSAPDKSQRLVVADSGGLVHPLTIGPPAWQWAWADPIGQRHDGIAGLAAYFHPGDGRHHCFVALKGGDVFELSFASLENRASLTDTWVGKLQGGALGIAGFTASDKSQHLFVVGLDGLVHPLEIGPANNWAWTWREAITAHHDGIVGIAAHWHPNDSAQHVFVVLNTGDVWEAIAEQPGTWRENWLGTLDGGASALAGHSADNGTQHLFAAAAPGGVLPLQIGAPYWKWRWDNSILPRRSGVVGLASYLHSGDDRQHVIALLQSGDIWESRFQLRSRVATQEWGINEFPISYWEGPLDSDNRLADYQRVADANFTFAMPTNAGGTFDENRALLAAAGTAGLKMFLKDGLVQSFRASSGLRAEDKQDLQKVVDNYSGHSAFAGYQMVGQNGTDELFPNDFAINSELVAFFRSSDPGHACFLEIIAEYGNAAYEPLTYDQYVEKYLSTVNPAVLCFHNYSLQSDFPGSFYKNIRIIRERAIAHDVPFWQFVLSTGHGAFRPPSAAELRRQAMQVLSFGGTGVLWFTYVNEPGWAPAIVDVDGTPLPRYPEVQLINADVRTVGRHLLASHSVAVYESGLLAGGGVPVPQTGLVRMRNAADVTIGVFSVPVAPNSSSANQSLVLIASRDASGPVSAALTFGAASIRKLDKASDAWSSVGVVAGPNSLDVSLTLAAGDAELLSVFAP